MLRGLATVTFYTDDMAATKQWYTELLGIEPYFERSTPDGTPGYMEYRIGDSEDELGFVNRAFAPHAGNTPGGAVIMWHVDDIDATLDRLHAMGAVDHDPRTVREAGFITASVVDPFGNVLGVMYNPHYLEMATQ